MQENDDNWTSVAIRRQRMNGLRLEAEKKKRSVGNVLDLVLDRAGVSELSDEQLTAKLKELEVSVQ